LRLYGRGEGEAKLFRGGGGRGSTSVASMGRGEILPVLPLKEREGGRRKVAVLLKGGVGRARGPYLRKKRGRGEACIAPTWAVLFLRKGGGRNALLVREERDQKPLSGRG